MELGWDELADQQMAALETQGPTNVVEAVGRTLARLELDPFDPKLGTRQFTSANYGHVRATTVHSTDWTVLWTLGEGDDWILIIAIGQYSL